ncbi:hypothetical protein HRbin36_01402 [bacterium HR36]|nr:hypothetical protein HRbin36_01402 [bacterium HR36]
MEQLDLLLQPAWLVAAALLALLGVALGSTWRWRQSALFHAWIWAGVALLANGVIWLAQARDGVSLAARYAGLVLALCPSIAVLGARQPGAAAWHFVVVGFAALAALPLLEQPWRSPEWHLDAPRSLLLSAVMVISWLNYLPTRLAWVISGLAWSVGWQLTLLVSPQQRNALLPVADWCTAAGLWWATLNSMVWTCAARMRQRGRTHLPTLAQHSECDAPTAVELELIHVLWHEIRDGWGLVWAWRVRELAQSAARHARLPGELRWSGLCCASESSDFQRAATDDLPATRTAKAAAESDAPVPVSSAEPSQVLWKWLQIMEAVTRRFAPPSHAPTYAWIREHLLSAQRDGGSDCPTRRQQ